MADKFFAELSDTVFLPNTRIEAQIKVVTAGKTKHILIIEDSMDLQMLLGKIFGLGGYKVAQALNGKEGLEYLRSHDLPCFILLDIMMPVMDGLEFLKDQKNDPALAKTPVVAMSADPRLLLEAQKMGTVETVAKPILNINNLLEIAQKWC